MHRSFEIDDCRKSRGVSHDCIEDVHLSTSVLAVTVSMRASRGERGRFLSGSVSALKIPARFGEFLVRERLGSEIRARNKQTRTNARSATYSPRSLHESSPRSLCFSRVPRQVHTRPWNYSNVTNMPNIFARVERCAHRGKKCFLRLLVAFVFQKRICQPS